MDYYTTKKKDRVIILVMVSSGSVSCQRHQTKAGGRYGCISMKFKHRQNSSMMTKSVRGIQNSRKGHEGVFWRDGHIFSWFGW